ncbi:MAG: PAS domain S-box protein [Acidimicrobiia bacterium]
MPPTGTQAASDTDDVQVVMIPETLKHHVERMPDPVLLLDDDLVVRYQTAGATALIGWDPADAVGRSVAEFVAPDDLPLVLRMAADLRLSGRVREVEVRVRPRDGSVRVVQVSASTFLDDPRVGLIVVTLRDVTRAVSRTQELVRARDFYLTLLDRFPNPIWRADAEASVDYVNQAYLSFTGRELQDEAGTGWTDLLHPDDRQRSIDVCSEAFFRRDPFQLEYRLRHHSGEFRWLFNTGEPVFGLEGEFLGYIGSCYDIDDRKRTEDLLRAAQADLVADVDALIQVADERRRVATSVVEADDRRAELIADEIENDQLQALAALNIRVELLRERLAGDDVTATLEPVTRSVQQTIARMRHLMEELRDPETRPTPP